MAIIPGLKNIDPIQGLVSYVQDIKPYHSKIFEVLVEYVYQDLVNVTIGDKTTLELDIDPSDTADTTFEEGIVQGAIATLGIITGGSNYIDGTYTNIQLESTPGGINARATLVVVGGSVTSVIITNTGTGYAVGDLLTVESLSIGGTGSGFSVPVTTITLILSSVITEMFDFFIIAPTPIAFNVTGYDATNGVVSITATTPNPSQVNQILPGSVLVIAGTFYDVSQSVYSTIPNSYVITLNITPPLSISGSGTAYNVDTSYSFTLPILSFHTGVAITEPVTGTSFSGSTFVVSGNATRAVQPGSIFKIKETNANYYTQYVQFVPAFAIDGAHVPALDTTIIGVSPPSADFPAIVTTGTIIPYRTTGYDNPYDGSYDKMAGYQLNYPAH